MWPFRKKQRSLPGAQRNPDGTIELSLTDEEQRAVDALFKMFEGQKFHPEIADIMPLAVTACALSRHSIVLVIPIIAIDTEAEFSRQRSEITIILDKAIAACFKATRLYHLPIFTHHLASSNEMAGHTAEAMKLKKQHEQQQAAWKPSELDQLLLKWLEH
jgi:hypothetical protein